MSAQSPQTAPHDFWKTCPQCGRRRPPQCLRDGGTCDLDEIDARRAVSSVHELTWNDVRAVRNAYLGRSDWVEFPGASVRLGADHVLWASYRQKLRDIPQEFTEPDAVVWPQPPGKEKEE